MAAEHPVEETDDNVLLEERQGDVLLLTLNRLRRHHALNAAISRRLRKAFKDAETEGVRAVVLTGAGEKAFCAGADMLEASGVEAGDGEKDEEPLPKGAGGAISAVARTPLPVIAAINGYCYGGGAAMAVCADILIAAENATFRLPGAEYGLVVGAATLPRLVGAAKAKELIFTARKFDAADALQCGMVNAVLPQNELLPYAMQMAQEIAANSVAAVQGSKRVIDMATLVDSALALEDSMNLELRGSPEQTDRFRDATKKVTGR